MVRVLGIVAIGALLLVAAPSMADADKGKAGKAHAQEMKEEAKAKVEGIEQPGPAAGEDMAEEQMEHAADAAEAHADNGKGALKSAEMKGRHAERKAAKAEYDAAVEGGAERVKGKKPWWKVWGE
jgi:hypothetical protein